MRRNAPDWFWIIVVLTIASAVLFVASEVRSVSRYKLSDTIVRQAAMCAERYREAKGGWPPNVSSLVKAGMLENDRDAWGNSLIMSPWTQERGYGYIASYGQDGKPGGEGRKADITRRFGAGE